MPVRAVPDDAQPIDLQFEGQGPAVALDDLSGRRVMVPEVEAEELRRAPGTGYVLFQDAGRWFVAAVSPAGPSRESVVVEAVSEPLHE